MVRIKFEGGFQKKFLLKVMEKINCPSLRELGNRLDVNYSTLKNYFGEKRCLSLDLFNNLCYLSKIDKNSLKIEFLEDNFGQIQGGQKGKRKSNTL